MAGDLSFGIANFGKRDLTFVEQLLATIRRRLCLRQLGFGFGLRRVRRAQTLAGCRWRR